MVAANRLRRVAAPLASRPHRDHPGEESPSVVVDEPEGGSSGAPERPRSAGRSASSSLPPRGCSRSTGSLHDRSFERGAVRMVASPQTAAPSQTIGVGAALVQMHSQREADRRRIAQLERKLDAKLEDVAGRERWAETHGSLNGLMEDVQALRVRVESLDARLWARIGGGGNTSFAGGENGGVASVAKVRELEQQIQAIDHQGRMATASIEETQRRLVSKFRRTEQGLEDTFRRVSSMEEQLRSQQSSGYGSIGSFARDSAAANMIEARLGGLETRQEETDTSLREMASQLQAVNNGPLALAEEAVEASERTERGLASLERRSAAQMQEMASTLASLKVKVDGQLQRLSSLAERLETAHEPAVEALRLELTQARDQNLRKADQSIAAMRESLREAGDAAEETTNELQSSLRQMQSDIGVVCPRLERLEVDVNEFHLRLSEFVRAGHADASEHQSQLEQFPLSGEDDVLQTPGGNEGYTSRSSGSFHDNGAQLTCPPSRRQRIGGNTLSPSMVQAQFVGHRFPADVVDAGASQHHGVSDGANVMETVVGQLRIADNLSTRITAMEKKLVDEGSSDNYKGDDQSRSARNLGTNHEDAAVAIAALTRDISELQARLLSSQLELHEEGESGSATGSGHALDGSPDITSHSWEQAQQVSAEVSCELQELSSRVVWVEGLLLGECGSPATPVSPNLRGVDDRAEIGTTSDPVEADQFAYLAERLEPLEDAFRQLSDQLSLLNTCGISKANGESSKTTSDASAIIDALTSGGDDLQNIAKKLWDMPQFETANVCKEINRTKQDLQCLSERVERGFRDAGEADAAFRQELDRVRDALDARIDKSTSLRGTPMKKAERPDRLLLHGVTEVPSSLSPLAPVRGRLDTLSEQVAAMEARTASAAFSSMQAPSEPVAAYGFESDSPLGLSGGSFSR